MKVVVLINCGGSINILELLEPEDDVNFYILDRYDVCIYSTIGSVEARPFQLLFTVAIIFLSSQRPLELDNVYNQDQVSNFCLVHIPGVHLGEGERHLPFLLNSCPPYNINLLSKYLL